MFRESLVQAQVGVRRGTESNTNTDMIYRKYIYMEEISRSSSHPSILYFYFFFKVQKDKVKEGRIGRQNRKVDRVGW